MLLFINNKRQNSFAFMRLHRVQRLFILPLVTEAVKQNGLKLGSFFCVVNHISRDYCRLLLFILSSVLHLHFGERTFGA